MCGSSCVKDEDGSDKLGFEYLDGPVTPKPEKIPRSGERQAQAAARIVVAAQAARAEGRGRRTPAPGLGTEGAAGQGLGGVAPASITLRRIMFVAATGDPCRLRRFRR